MHQEAQAESNSRLDDIANSTVAGGISTKKIDWLLPKDSGGSRKNT